jgi:hypothetical protein
MVAGSRPIRLLSGGYPTTETSQRLKDELVFQNAVETYLWALQALNMYGLRRAQKKSSTRATTHCRFGDQCVLRADSGPKKIDSGRTGVRVIAVVPL